MTVDLGITGVSTLNKGVNNIVVSSTWFISQDYEYITFQADIDSPSGGFIQKGAIVELIADIDGFIYVEQDSFVIGDNIFFNISFELEQSQSIKIENNEILELLITLFVTPIYLGIAFNSATKIINLAPDTISR